MSDWTVNLKVDKLNKVGMNKAKTLVGNTTRVTFNRAQVLCPVDTTRLRASSTFITLAEGLSWRGRVTFSAEYAAAVHNGRRALTIRPRSTSPKARLRFVVGGRVVYARQVHQKARAARPWLYNALKQTAERRGFTVVREDSADTNDWLI